MLAEPCPDMTRSIDRMILEVVAEASLSTHIGKTWEDNDGFPPRYTCCAGTLILTLGSKTAAGEKVPLVEDA